MNMSAPLTILKTIFLTIVYIIHVKCSFIDPETLTVCVQEGLVRGRSGRTVGGSNGYYAFQGIPYAEPPTGPLRFEAPVPKKPWSVTFNATKDGNMCTQGTTTVEGSENCLIINVYVPKVSGNVLLPVLAFIHGGAFTFGNSSFDLYGPDFLLDEKIIVVTFNYRLGIFGFLSTGDSVVPGNNGLKDQVLALKWVKNNIKNFGGDPQKVTICGESAGAVSVSHHMQSPQSRGLFRGVILQSGSSLSEWGLYRVARETNYLLGKEYGLNPQNSQAFVDGLKRQNASDLHKKSTLILDFQSLVHEDRHGLIFGPVIEPPNKNAFITTRSHELLVSGNFSQVPLLIGFNSLESMAFQIEEEVWIFRYDINNSLLLPIDLNVSPNRTSSAASALKNYYFSKGLIALSGYNLTKFIGDDAYVRPALEYVRRTYDRIPVYLYKFSYRGNLGGAISRLYPGVGHAEDLAYIWKLNYVPYLSPEDKVIRKRMVTWWADFTKFGNPTPPSSVLIWPRSDVRFTHLDINAESQVKQYPQKADMEFWDSIYKKYGHPPYDTY